MFIYHRIILVMCCLVLVGCHRLFPTPASTNTWSPQIAVTGDPLAELPDNCRPENVAKRLVEFFQAINRGDAEQLTEFFGSEFTWFSMSESNGEEVIGNFTTYYDRDALSNYFADRHEQGEQWQLYAVRVNALRGRPGTPQGNYIDFEYTMGRSSPNLVESFEHMGHGKGVFHCVRQTISVWSSGTSPATDVLRLNGPCPPFLDDTDGAVVIACSHSE